MLTEEKRQIILNALDDKVASINRSKAKATNPRFAPIYDEEIATIRECQQIVRSWLTQASTSQEPEGKNRR